VPQALIPANVPLYFQCIAVPVVWERAKFPVKEGYAKTSPVRVLSEMAGHALGGNNDLLEVRVSEQGELLARKPTFFDPWEKRNEFFRLERGDVNGLLQFLPTVGIFERAGHTDTSDFVQNAVLVPSERGLNRQIVFAEQITATHIWKTRRSLLDSLEHKTEIGDVADFNVRLVGVKKQPRAVVTTTTFLDAVLLSLATDRILDLKVQKCARPDCGISFTVKSGHEKKYCERYCAHIESVRRDRERKKLVKETPKGR